MQNFFTIIIRDESGVKQFTLHRHIKHVAVYSVIALFVLIIGGLASAIYLNGEVNTLTKKKFALQEKSAALEKKSEALRLDIDERQAALDEAQVRMEAIEMLMGLSSVENVSLMHRVETAQLTSQQRASLLQVIPNGSPIEYKGITSKFGYRTHPTKKTRELHRGTDMRAAMKTPIYATADAVVEFAGKHNTKGYGRLIILDHTYGFRTYFGHLNSIKVKNGQFVKKGELIGYTGNSGISNGPHLHYEVRFIQRSLNPYWFIKWNMKNYEEIFMKEKKVSWDSLVNAVVKPADNEPKVLLTKAKHATKPTL